MLENALREDYEPNSSFTPPNSTTVMEGEEGEGVKGVEGIAGTEMKYEGRRSIESIPIISYVSPR